MGLAPGNVVGERKDKGVGHVEPLIPQVTWLSTARSSRLCGSQLLKIEVVRELSEVVKMDPIPEHWFSALVIICNS